jgi:hypothetical protein
VIRKATTHSIRAVLFAALSFMTIGAHAALISASAVPSSRSVVTGTVTPVSFVWQVNEATQPPLSNTATSPFGSFRLTCGGQELGRVNVVLSRTQGQSNTPVTHTISETVSVPADITLRAHRLGAGSICYQRTFDNPSDPNPVTGSLTLTLTSSAATGLRVTREALAFDNGAAVRVIGLNQPIAATAELSFTGSGLLQAQWEIATPPSTAGSPVFRVLSHVRQQIVNDVQVFDSPELPTHTAGLYLVRLRITDPAPAFEMPVIRYFVSQTPPNADARAPNIALAAPAPRALYVPDTAFVWEPISGARAYQIEIYAASRDSDVGLPDLTNRSGEPSASDVADALSRPPVTGMLITGRQTRAALSAVARQHLQPGRSYFWRVLAIGEGGSVVGVSPVRDIRVP